ncbi:hypothetical protein WT10_30385 [Burkholderia stagnalis]|nr:hypothetical protein WS59_16880 [Burkholderia stagnalis]KVN10698.1 hypothetical protein WT10_30385 [Burkholderia stagnalis]KWI74476.1 hypothetical protein WT75_07490 [Burkholderia stagnalis]KWN08641.1 hypothetical protein WT84_29705 [Burkholderia stagnalis]KWN36284.1 hypothetical protein WT85_07410 [Burkholderia stagnalis]
MGQCLPSSLGRPPENRMPSPAGSAFFVKGAYEGCAMNLDFCCGVPDPVRQACTGVCSADTPYRELSVEAAKRLVTDRRMETFYRSESLGWARGPNADIAWRLWFDAALDAANADEDASREAIKRQRANVSELVRVLDAARDLLNEIEQDETAAPISIPIEFTDVLHLLDATAQHPGIVDGCDRSRYEANARPRLDEIFRFNGSAACFIPSVAQLITGLSASAFGLQAQLDDRATIPWRGQFAADQFTSQKSNKYRAYVRSVDRAMWELRFEYTDENQAECWRLPDSLLAIQCKVALGESDLEGFVERMRKHRLSFESDEL